MQQIFLYCLALVAKEQGIMVHAVVLMSDHYHIVLTDLRGNFPLFVRELNRILACVTKSYRDWPEEVFNKSQTSRVELETPAAIANEIGYTLANPVACFAVRYPCDWPGVTVHVGDIGAGRGLRVPRPAPYFDRDNPRWPAVAELTFTLPDALVAAAGSPDAARAAIRTALERHVEEAHADARQRGKCFLGARRVVRAAITACATNDEELSRHNPTYATAGDPIAAAEACARRRDFLARHAEALRRWRAGDRAAIFPAGTWWMRVHHGATCAAPP